MREKACDQKFNSLVVLIYETKLFLPLVEFAQESGPRQYALRNLTCQTILGKVGCRCLPPERGRLLRKTSEAALLGAVV